MPSHCHCLLRLAGAGIDLSLRRIASLASRPRLRVSRSLRIDRRGSAGVSTAASARLAGGRGDAVASPALPLRIAPCRCHRAGADRHGSLASRRSLRIAGSLRLARADRTRLSTAPVSLASRPRLRVSRSLRIDRRVSPGMSLAASARLAGGRGDAVASPALPLRIAPCRCHRAGADRHGSLASRRSLRIAGSLRLARADRTRLSTAPVSLASRPRLRVSRSLRIDRRGPTKARLARGAAMPAHCEHQLRIARAPGPADRPMTP